MFSLTKYIKNIIFKFKNKISVDEEFYDDDFFVLYDLEG